MCSEVLPAKCADRREPTKVDAQEYLHLIYLPITLYVINICITIIRYIYGYYGYFAQVVKTAYFTSLLFL